MRAAAKSRFVPACILVLLAACASPGPAIRVEEAWARPTAGPAPGAAYLSIHNDGKRPDRLLGARSDRCATVEIHRTRVVEGRARMTPAGDGIAVGPGETVELKPGGHHLMLFEPAEPLRDGERFELTLEFEEAGEVRVEIQVRR